MCNAFALLMCLYVSYMNAREFIMLVALQFPLEAKNHLPFSLPILYWNFSCIVLFYIFWGLLLSFILFFSPFFFISLYREWLVCAHFPSAFDHQSIVISKCNRLHHQQQTNRKNEMVCLWLYLLPCVSLPINHQARKRKKNKKNDGPLYQMLNFIAISRVLLYPFIAIFVVGWTFLIFLLNNRLWTFHIDCQTCLASFNRSP